MREPYDRYSNVSIWLHWVIAVLLLGNVVGGLLMEDNRWIFPLHKSFGIAVLVLTLVRIGWRVAHPLPALPEGTAGWERVLARVSHVAFYILLLVVPLLGWAAMSSGRGVGKLFGVIPWFDLPVARSHDLHEAFGSAHETAVWVTLGLVAVHVAGALKHHLVNRDVVLSRMLPIVGRPGR